MSKKVKYIRIITGEGEHIFVREKDMQSLKKTMRAKSFNAKRIVAQCFRVFINSPEGMEKLHKSMSMLFEITRLDNIKQLENLKGLIESRINAIKHKKFIEKQEQKKNERQSKNSSKQGADHKRS